MTSHLSPVPSSCPMQWRNRQHVEAIGRLCNGCWFSRDSVWACHGFEHIKSVASTGFLWSVEARLSSKCLCSMSTSRLVSELLNQKGNCHLAATSRILHTSPSLHPSVATAATSSKATWQPKPREKTDLSPALIQPQGIQATGEKLTSSTMQRAPSLPMAGPWSPSRESPAWSAGMGPTTQPTLSTGPRLERQSPLASSLPSRQTALSRLPCSPPASPRS